VVCFWGRLTKPGELHHEDHERHEPDRGYVRDGGEVDSAVDQCAGAPNTQQADHEDEADGHGDTVSCAGGLSPEGAEDGYHDAGEGTMSMLSNPSTMGVSTQTVAHETRSIATPCPPGRVQPMAMAVTPTHPLACLFPLNVPAEVTQRR
jgi:hypothetical protein